MQADQREKIIREEKSADDRSVLFPRCPGTNEGKKAGECTDYAGTFLLEALKVKKGKKREGNSHLCMIGGGAIAIIV